MPTEGVMYSIIIPTYNHLEDCLKPCLESIFRNTTIDESIEIIVVANGCTDGTQEYVKSVGCKVLDCPVPLGYTPAVNWGLREASGKYIILLNNDAGVADSPKNLWLRRLQAPFEDKRVAVTGPHMLLDETIGRQFLVFYMVMISRAGINKLGYLDESFAPGFGEDIDYCLRAESHGMRFERCEVPTFHRGEASFHEPHVRDGYEEVVKRNQAILLNRYGNAAAFINDKLSEHGRPLRLEIITPLSRARYMDALTRSIFDLNWLGIDVRHTVVVDRIAVHHEETPRHTKQRILNGEQIAAGFGNELRNVALKTIMDEEWADLVYFLDDDNMMHPNFPMVIREMGSSTSFTVHQRRSAYNPWDRRSVGGHKLIDRDQQVKMAEVDTAQFVWKREDAVLSKWMPSEYAADYFYAKSILDAGVPLRHSCKTAALYNASKNPSWYGDMDLPKTDRITAVVSSRDRYDQLLVLMTAVATQTVIPDELLVFDDGSHADVKDNPAFKGTFALLSQKGVDWKFIWTDGKGQVHNHDSSIGISTGNLIWRLDDDTVPQPNCLEMLLSCMGPEVGAVGGIVVEPGARTPPHDLPVSAEGRLNPVGRLFDSPNAQWFLLSGPPVEAEHLYSSFLYRKHAAPYGYCTKLSQVGHREETIFSHEIMRAGWKLLIQPAAITWHLRSPKGGIRSGEEDRSHLFRQDEAVFVGKSVAWAKADSIPGPIFNIEAGVGDHICMRRAIREAVVGRYPRVGISSTIPSTLGGPFEWAEILGPEIGNNMLNGKKELHSPYRYMAANVWTGTLLDACRAVVSAICKEYDETQLRRRRNFAGSEQSKKVRTTEKKEKKNG